MGWDAPWHWVVLAIIVIALFGYKKLPDAARSVGRSLRIFKTEIKGMTEDDKKRDEAAQPVAPKQLENAAPPQPATPAPVHVTPPPVNVNAPADVAVPPPSSSAE